MKIKGKKIEGPNEEVVVIPRGENPPIVFKCKAVIDYSSFEKMCPLPQPPKSQRPGGSWFENPEDPGYKKLLGEHARLETDWMILQSISATEGLEWEKVKAEKPDTWKLWRDELKEAGFSMPEINLIFQGVWKANSLDENMLKSARESFFRSQQAASS